MRGNILDVDKMLTELRREREQIDEAILTLERLARGRGKRRGRPPAWLKDAAAINAMPTDPRDQVPADSKRKLRAVSTKNSLVNASEG